MFLKMFYEGLVCKRVLMKSLSADAYFPTIYQVPNEALEGWHAEVRMGCSRDRYMGGISQMVCTSRAYSYIHQANEKQWK